MWSVAAGRQRLLAFFICPRMRPVAERDEPMVCPLEPGEPDFVLDPSYLYYAEYKRKRGKWVYTDFSIDTGFDDRIAEVRDAFGLLDMVPKWYRLK